MQYEKYLATEKFPTIWCPGCSLSIILKEIAQSFNELDLKKEELATISGIGCTGRISNYFSNDSVHTPHGRPIPVAEGIKKANPKINTVVISGDGDLLGIGGNHLLHAARRNENITVICVSNQVYGLTGGQQAPTTPKGVITLTSPKGLTEEPINVQGLLTLNKKHFYARADTIHREDMKNSIKEALQWDGFSFVEIVTICITNLAKRQDEKRLTKMKRVFQLQSEKGILKDNELGIDKHE